MRVLLPRAIDTLEGCVPAETPTEPALSPRCLKKLGERLRLTYEVAEPLPVRLTELVDC